MNFKEYQQELEDKWVKFQANLCNHSNQLDYFIHRNVITYDHQIKYISRYNHPCTSCGLPLFLINNYVIVDIGDVCGVCHSLYTIISSSSYFLDLHRKSKKR